MVKTTFDPGLTQQYTGALRRVINKDGSFNVRKVGGTWRDFHPYLHLINMRWPLFLGLVFGAYLLVNTLFAVAYYAAGPDQLRGADATTASGRFVNDFFFSAHTLSTVGYGSISPVGIEAQILAAMESMLGVMAFAVATGLLYGRVSRPSARLGFSHTMVVAPYQGGTALEFRMVNLRKNSLMELEANVMLMVVETVEGTQRRNYHKLSLERSGVMFLPFTWTVVHPIDPASPLWGLEAEDLRQLQAEIFVMVKAYDDTFNQTVLARNSYRHDEIVWDRKFAPAFQAGEDGTMVVEVNKVGALL